MIAPPAHRLGDVPDGLLIGGRWRPAAGGATMVVGDPATRRPGDPATRRPGDPASGDALAEVADATDEDGLEALEAAHAAQGRWGRSVPGERAGLLRAAHEELMVRREELARLITLEMGKPQAESRAEVDYGADFLRWFAGEAVRIAGDYRPAPDGRSRIVVSRHPVGVCLLITPWNFPLAMAARKVAAALAAGCTAILKPAEQTPLTTLAFAKLLQDLGLPAGVLGVLTTSDPARLTGPMIRDGRLSKLSFTGSTAVGRILLARCADQVVRASMELGGNAPFIVFADADLGAAVDGAVLAKMRNTGQACTAANRFLVQSSVAEHFTERLAGRLAQLRMGPGLDAGSDVGPLIDERARARVRALVDEAVEEGARLVVGGSIAPARGSFYPPTLLDGVGRASGILREEIFGPVAPVVRFEEEDEAIAVANDSQCGLVAYAYTRDLQRAVRLGDELETGMIAVNRGLVANAAAPFGGVKQSGLGREGGREGIEDYLEVKYLNIER